MHVENILEHQKHRNRAHKGETARFNNHVIVDNFLILFTTHHLAPKINQIYPTTGIYCRTILGQEMQAASTKVAFMFRTFTKFKNIFLHEKTVYAATKSSACQSASC